MKPNEVLYPRDRIRDLHVIYNNGHWSLATLEWYHNSTSRWSRRVAMRWNGYGAAIGHPQFGDQPVWFLLPPNVIAKLALAYARCKAIAVIITKVRPD